MKLAPRRTGSIYQKHLLALRGYSTPRKLANMVLCEIEKRMRVARPRSMPYAATIDVTNACNLRCPGCPTGVGILGRPKTLLTPEHLRKFLDEAGPYLLLGNLYNWGETLLHPEAAGVVEAFHEARIFTSISSNLIIKDFRAIEAVCDAGLDHLIISADGATRESYPVYRVGGDFDLLIENIRGVVDYRRRTGRKRPILEWVVLGFRHLEKELDQARALAQELGVDWFNVKAPTAPARFQIEGLEGRSDKNRAAGNCALLWHSVTLQADGGIGPCCYLYSKEDDFGHIDATTVREARHQDRYVRARMLFDPGKLGMLDPQMDHPCLRCPIVHHQAHLEGFLRENPHAFVEEDFMGILTKKADLEKTWKGM